MLQNFFLIVFRNLTKHSFYSFITIFGLAVGLAAGFLILQYVYYETTYDHFFENKENIYRVQLDRYDKGTLSTQWAAGCAGAGLAMKEDFPEVKEFVNLARSRAMIGYNKKYFKPDYAYYAGKTFFEVFSVPLLQGIDSLVLKDPFTVVISESLSKKIFGKEDPVGKKIKMNDTDDFEVTGIFQDLPERSHMKFDLLYSFETYVNFTSENARTAWQWDGFLNYVVLHPGTDVEVLKAKFPEFVQRREGEELARYNAGMEFNLQPLTDIHLVSNYRGEIKPTGDKRATYFLLIIGLFVLVIAWINYINLSTAHSFKRAREVGIRKVLGSNRGQLIRQFLLESSFMNLLAILLAAVFVLISFPYFNNFLGRSTAYTWPDAPFFWLGLVVLFIIGILLSGFYPAMVLSDFRPVTVLKGKFTGSTTGNFMRKGLVTFQFIASIFLITGTYVVYNQLQYLQSQDLGVNIDQTLVVNTPRFSSDSILAVRYDVFRNRLEGESTVKSMTISSAVPGRTPNWNAGGIRLIHQTEAESNQYRVMGGDHHFIDYYGLEVVAGRKFDPTYGQEESNVLFNEAAMRRIGFNDPDELLNQKIQFWGDTMTVVGVVKNYRQESPKQAYDALIFRYFSAPSGYYSIRLNSSNMQQSIHLIRQHWETAFANKPFDFFFLDDYYNEQYKAELSFGTIFGFFALLAILVACLGLFGLASYVTNLRSKEISVRKVLGASLQNLWWLLSLDFLKWVGMAILIAAPLNWYIMNNWLENFASRISLSWWIFLIPAVILIAIATATVSFHTLKMAFINPAKTLKEE